MRIQEFLRDLSARVSVTTNGDAHAWQIITALRGCDSANHNLKDLTEAPNHFRLHWQEAVKSVIALYSYDLDTETDIPKGEGESE